jgi:hypothetical protein
MKNLTSELVDRMEATVFCPVGLQEFASGCVRKQDIGQIADCFTYREILCSVRHVVLRSITSTSY